MEQVKSVKVNDTAAAELPGKKRGDNVQMKSKTVFLDQEFGVKLTLDNSLKRFANEKFFVEHAQRVDNHFTKKV